MTKLKIIRQDGQVRFLKVFGQEDRDKLVAKLRADKSVKSVQPLTIPASR